MNCHLFLISEYHIRPNLTLNKSILLPVGVSKTDGRVADSADPEQMPHSVVPDQHSHVPSAE